MKMRSFNRIVAVMLCVACLIPNFTGLAEAIGLASAAPRSVKTNSKLVPVSDPFAAGEIPAYQTVGAVTPNALVTDCGNGVTRDQAKSYLKMVTGTTDVEFLAFKTAMVNAGFTITAARNLPGSQDYNLFYRFLSPNKNYVVTAYYVAKLGEAHIVADTGEDAVKSFSTGFVYDSQTNEVAQPMMTLYGLSMSPNGYDISTTTSYGTGARNCGAMVVIRMPDNSLFINDGGDVQQWSDEACADFMTFCRELTGKQEGEKVIINTWFISHAHSDHYNGIPRFFAKYHDQIDILNVMYNIDDERANTTRDMTDVLNMVAAYFPNTKYYKPHTGDHFNIAGVEFDVLYTQEDRFYPGADGNLNVGENVIYEEVVNHAIVMDMLVSVKDHQTGYSTANINITPDMLVDSDGNAVDFSKPGIYPDLSPVYGGEVIDTGYTIQVSQDDASLQYPSVGAVGSVTAGKQGTTSEKNFLSTGVANIQLSATAIPEEKGVDLIVVLDLSGSMNKEVNSNNSAADYSDSRMAVMEESLREMIATLQGSGKDVRIAMSDFGDLDHYTFPGAVTTNSNFHRPYYDINKDGGINISYEFFNHLNYFLSRNPDGTVDYNAGIYETSGKKYNMAHSQYTGILTPTVYTGSGQVGAEAFVSVDTLGSAAMASIISKLDENVSYSLGTNYDIGLEYAYRLGYAIRRENEANGQDRELVCIFLSDGAAIQYNYFAGRTASTSWRDVLNGVPDEVTSISDVYKDPSNWPEEIENISRVMLELMATPSTNFAGFGSLLTNEYRTRSTHEYFRYYPKNEEAGYTYRYFYTYMDHQGYELDWPYLQKLAKANGLDNFQRGEKGFNYTYVDAEGVTHTVTDDNVLQPLIDLFTDKSAPVYTTDEAGNQVVNYYSSKLLNPDYRNKCSAGNQTGDRALVAGYRFYPLHSDTIITDGSVSYTDQFFAAMESVGYPCDWALYAELTFINKEAIDDALDPGDLKEPMDAEDPTKHQNVETTDIRKLIEKIKTPTGTENGVYQTLSPYAYFYNAEGKNWWAEAIKGNTDQLYPVINKYALENNPNWTDAYYGDVRNRFTTGTGLPLDGQDYISGFAGLDMALYTVSFAIADDRLLTSEDYYHATNTSAILHYINYLGQNSTLDTQSPKYPWGDAKVGYGYYLVNEQGQMLANRITVAYTPFFDHNTADDAYDFYMDAVRIYDPAGDGVSEDTLIGGTYGEDGEFAPSYEELRNILLTERNFYDTIEQLGDEYFTGAVFIDGIPMLNDDNYDSSFKKDPPQIGTYMNYGPNNEVYLAPGQAIAFELNKPEDMKAVHMALKSTYGTAKIKIFRAGSNIADAGVMEIATATDRYYDLTELAGETVIVVNVGGTGDGILSITNLKVTTKTEAEANVAAQQVFTISRRSAQKALQSLTAQEDTAPETGDIHEELMFSLALLACLSAAAILTLTYMYKNAVKAEKTNGRVRKR